MTSGPLPAPSIAASASSRVVAIVAPAPAARPSALLTTARSKRAIPGLPGSATNRAQLGDCLSRHASASSRPPEPNSRIFMDLPDDDRPGLLANVGTGDNSPALSVSELSGALKRAIETTFGLV